MIEKFRALQNEVDDLRERSRQLNLKLSELNGVAAVIPRTYKYPLNAFRGSRVILHNVEYDIHSGKIKAVIGLPHRGDDRLKGHLITTNIDENWFTTGSQKGYNEP